MRQPTASNNNSRNQQAQSSRIIRQPTASNNNTRNQQTQSSRIIRQPTQSIITINQPSLDRFHQCYSTG